VLDAAVRDAHRALSGGALWLGALGYLIVVEAIGATVSRHPPTYPNRDTPTKTFMAGAREFAPTPVSATEARALYALRSSLAHSYNLRNYVKGKNPPFYRFALDETGPLIHLAVPPWDGSTRPTPFYDTVERKKFTTAVNVLEIGRYVEDLVANVRAERAAGRAIRWHDVNADDLMAFGQYYVD